MAHADAVMKRLTVDKRTVSFGYNPNQVYTVPVYVGYLTRIQLSPQETIVDTGSGLDAETVWETAQPAPHIFNLKPKIVTGDTNVAFTTRIGSRYRTYMFHFKIKEHKADNAAEPMIWNVTFWYPRSKRTAQPVAATPPKRPSILNTPESERNYEYYYSGHKRLVPGVAFDNGTFTFMRFSPDRDWPLIYVVDMQTGDERLVNTRREGPDVIVEGVYDILVLRYGQAYACIFNAARVKSKEHAVAPILVRGDTGTDGNDSRATSTDKQDGGDSNERESQE